MKKYCSNWNSCLALIALVMVHVRVAFCQNLKTPEQQRKLLTERAKQRSEVMIKGAVYQEMLGKRREMAQQGSELGASFLEAAPSERAYLQSLFTKWVPRVEVGTTNNVQFTKTNVLDRLTSKPARLYRARVLSQTNLTALAEGAYYFTPRAGWVRKYQLVYNGTNWVVTSMQTSLVW